MPGDVDDPAVDKACGSVELPLHVRWSGSPKVYDLAERGDRLRVYEQVLREGNDDDVRRFIDMDEFIRLWDELVLPSHVREPGPSGSTVTADPTLRASPLQRRVAAIIGDLPEASDFVLAGGAALIAHGEVNRRTRDLD